MPDIKRQQDYSWHLSSSFEKTGGNADSLALNPGQTLTVLDTDGPGMVFHIWFTINDRESYYLKRIVLRMYWDGDKDPSVEAPIGDFFGLGLGISYPWQSEVLSVGNSGALNCFFPMPYRHHARITLTNEGKEAASNLYWNIEYRITSPNFCRNGWATRGSEPPAGFLRMLLTDDISKEDRRDGSQGRGY